jgi:hypothetical protein
MDTIDMQQLLDQSTLEMRGQRDLNRPDVMKQIETWDDGHGGGILVQAREVRELELSVQPGWFIFKDGASRSNDGSFSEMVEPPRNKRDKWEVIAAYWLICKSRTFEQIQAKAYAIREHQIRYALNPSPLNRPDANEADLLDLLLADFDEYCKHFKRAARMVKKHTPKETIQKRKERQELERETLEYDDALNNRIDSITKTLGLQPARRY